jgi:hypothetical protein
MASDTWAQLLGPGAGTVIGIALLTLIKSFRDNRTKLREGYEQREQRRYDRALRRLDAFQACAEAHQPWDVDMRVGMSEIRHELNLIREEAGKPPREWHTIPPPPPLFPPPEEDHPGP